MALRKDKHDVGVAYQIPRNALVLLMIAQLGVIVPLITHISTWIVGVCIFCGYWRIQVYRGRWGYPASWVKVLLVLAAFIGIIFSGFATFSLEAATSLLVLAFALKLVEMNTRRDAYLVIYLSYFLVATAFLFDQSMALTGYEVLAAIVVTGAMVSMNQLQTRVRPLPAIRLAAGLILQALPLTLVLFLLFPRIAPLWSIPMPSAATTGISDHLKPGDVANLTRSDEIAFRVDFDGTVPAARDLYWRGLVYSHFEEGEWSVATPLATMPKPQSVTAALSYEVFLEPTQAEWLFALDTPIEVGARIRRLADYRLVAAEPVLSVKRYRVRSDTGYVMDQGPVLDAKLRERETALPADDNQRIRGYARKLRAEAGSDWAMIEAMQDHIREQDYVYTLQPPRLPSLNSIDTFWFDTRRGFCSHYAGAMVFALRAAGIPARLVGGYQGGEVNSVTGHLEVRQYLAHAWVEAWIKDQGWRRVDPTAAVAPNRVELGLNAALSSADLDVLSFLTTARLGDTAFFSGALDWLDSVEHRWNLWVVGYDANTQSDVLKSLLGEVTPARVGLALFIGGGMSMALVTLSIFWRRRARQQHPAERRFYKFCSAMARQGLARMPGETPAAYITRISELAQLDPKPIIRRLQGHLYDPDATMDSQALRDLRQDFRKLRFKLAFNTTGNAS